MDYKEKFISLINDKTLPIEQRKELEEIYNSIVESEDDKVRKALLDLFKIENFNGYVTLNGIDVDDVITWLEKQSEKKPKWTNEDSSMQLTLMRDIEQISFISKEGKDERIMWLNKLDDRFAHQDINGEQKSEWGDEDEDNLNSAKKGCAGLMLIILTIIIGSILGGIYLW